jgi:DNA-binding response OmpR family regulator
MQMREGNGKLRSILVVDDDKAISKLIKYNLEDKVTQVIEAETGIECMRVLCEASIDLVLLDIRLPDFNGWDILNLLRITEPLQRIPVIVLSAEPPDMFLLNQFKPDDYIQKPFEMRDLISRIGSVIHQEV